LPDVTPPVITAVQATNVTVTGARITWTTNEAATSQVNYGLTTSYGSNTTLDTTRVTSHGQNLTGLTPNTLYHYRVRSRDAAGNEAVSGDFTFVTATEPITNLARGILPTVSGTYRRYSVSAITDGVIAPRGGTATTWASDQSSNPHWVEINYGANRTIDSVAIYWAWNSSQNAWMTSRQVRVQRWNGSGFVDIIVLNNTTLDSVTISSFAPVTTSRIRFYQPSNMGPASYQKIMWLTEIETWGIGSGQSIMGIPGDVNGSGHLDGTDLVYLIRFLAGGPPPKTSIESADVDGSGHVDKGDVDHLMEYFKGSGTAPVSTRESISSNVPDNGIPDNQSDQ
jgi:hypothetical protein